jgi:hypothetical protein
MVKIGHNRVYETKRRLNQAIAAFTRHGWRVKTWEQKGKMYRLEVYHPWPFVYGVLRKLKAIEKREQVAA